MSEASLHLALIHSGFSADLQRSVSISIYDMDQKHYFSNRRFTAEDADHLSRLAYLRAKELPSCSHRDDELESSHAWNSIANRLCLKPEYRHLSGDEIFDLVFHDEDLYLSFSSYDHFLDLLIVGDD
jgi:hypothetical protein